MCFHPFFFVQDIIYWTDSENEDTGEKNKMKKAVFFDIDGTLWNQQMQIPESTVSAVQQLRENGHYAFICSGRSRANIRDQRLLGIGFDGVIAACGTHIDFHGKKEYEKLFSAEQTAHVIEVLRKYQMPMVLEGPDYIYVDEEDFPDDPYVLYLRRELGEHLKTIPMHAEEIVINKLSCSIKAADIAQVKKELGTEFDMIVHHDGGIAEIVPAGYSKATGIEKVCEIFNILHENTYAFGDSANDLEMLSYVEHSVAMGNGTKEAKEAAEYVTDDIDSDGILKGLLHYGLIESRH